MSERKPPTPKSRPALTVWRGSRANTANRQNMLYIHLHFIANKAFLLWETKFTVMTQTKVGVERKSTSARGVAVH